MRHSCQLLLLTVWCLMVKGYSSFFSAWKDRPIEDNFRFSSSLVLFWIIELKLELLCEQRPSNKLSWVLGFRLIKWNEKKIIFVSNLIIAFSEISYWGMKLREIWSHGNIFCRRLISWRRPSTARMRRLSWWVTSPTFATRRRRVA